MMDVTASGPPRGSSGRVIVVSGPSGAGKTSLCKALLESLTGLAGSVSYTTRPPRQGEVSGKDYHFVDTDAFERMVREGAFLEWSEVHGHFYGTSERQVRELLARSDLLLEVDCKGAAKLKEKMPGAVLVFVMPASVRELVARIRRRGPISTEDLARRMETARQEIQSVDRYDYLVINERFEDALDQLRAIVIAARCATAALSSDIKERWREEFAAFELPEEPVPR